MRMLIFLVAALGVLAAQAGADEYWITYEGNDLPENEGWGRSWGNDEGQYHGDGAYRTLEDGILTMDSLYDLRVYDYAYLYGQFDPDPGELFVAEWRLKVDETIGDGYDTKVGISSDDDWQLGIACFPDHVESKFEDDVEIPITPGVFHEYRVLTWDMQAYDLYIDGDLAHQGAFWQGSLASKFGWGDCVSGAASLSHWDYVHFGVVPEPSVLWLFIGGLAPCVLRTVSRRARRVGLLPVLACVLAASATADPYWITYEGNDLPENESWGRSWGNNEGQYHGDGAVRTVENGILTMDSLYDLRVYDYAYRYLYGEVDPDPGELFVAEWRVKVDESIGDGRDSMVVVASDGAMQLAFGLFPDHIDSQFEDDVYISIAPAVFHQYRVLSWDMQTYELYIDGDLAHEGTFWQGYLESKLAWGDGVSGAASLAHWDYVHFGVVPEPSSLMLLIGICVCARRSNRGNVWKRAPYEWKRTKLERSAWNETRGVALIHNRRPGDDGFNSRGG